ncbi:MAG: hypothetical protein CMM67_09800 [Rhodospirillaceae bacterium]|nr:hypothetical protein [Rhodospirillaceae bacterium]OUT77014.1 MAG: hypothetical protein CBB83_09980 [Rhodospirillaceae bacterium TMED23]
MDSGIREELLQKLWANARSIRKETGCFQFEVSISNDNPNEYILYEVYKNLKALEFHRTQTYFIEYLNTVKKMGNKVTRTFKSYTILDSPN